MENSNFASYTSYIDDLSSDEKLKAYYAQHPNFSNEYLDRYLAQLTPAPKTIPITTPEEKKRYSSSDIIGNKEYFAKLLGTRTNYVSPVKNEITDEITNLDVSDEDKEYLVKLAGRESNYNPTVKNKYGYYGLYQFGDSALKDIGENRHSFKDSSTQHNGALKLAKLNESRLQNVMGEYVGKKFRGLNITRNGVLAAAHLLGANKVQKWFNEKEPDSKDYHDGFGTKIEEYLNLYS
jgi:hypothetical protein